MSEEILKEELILDKQLDIQRKGGIEVGLATILRGFNHSKVTL